MAQQGKEEPGDEPILIRRYENRRLYDTSSSRYVNLADVKRLLRRGRRIRVMDAGSGEDVTRRVLAQIVLEQSERGGQGLPLEVLYELARTPDRAFRDFLDWYLRSSMEVYRRLQDYWQEEARRRWGSARPALEAWAQLWDPRQVGASLAQLLSPALGERPPLSPREADQGEGEEAETPSDGDAELAELRQRLDQLERRLQSLQQDQESPGDE